MDDQQVWDQGLRCINSLLAGLSSDKLQSLAELLACYRQEKELMASITLQNSSETLCRECAGQCCQNGKYRINVFDLVAYCISELNVSPDFEQKPLCPYGTEQGCLMEPGFRPADCITFLCDVLDNQLSDSVRSSLQISETKLRECLQLASLLLSIPVDIPLLIWAENVAPQPILY